MEFAPPQTSQSSQPQDRGELAQIDELKRGLPPFFEALSSLASSAQQVFISNVFTPEIRAKLQEVRTELERAVGRFGTMCRDVQQSTSEENVSRAAAREYHNFFKEQINDHRMSMVRMAKQYAALKEFQIEADELLHRIVKFVKSAEIPAQSDFYKQFLNLRIAPATRGNEALRVFCARMATLLGMAEEPSSLKSLGQYCKYSPDITYGYSSLFTPDLKDFVAGRMPTDEPAEELLLPKKQRFQMPAKDAPEEPHLLNAGGDMHWNRGTHYYFNYEPDRLEEERKKFAAVVHIDSHLGADANMLKGTVIRNFARREQAIRPDEVEGKYTEFLMTYFDLVTDISMLNLGIPADTRSLFLFHLGPLSFFYLTKRFLQEAGTGTLHLRSGRSMITKYLPVELLRKTVIDWWREKVLPAVGPERNDSAAFHRITKSIRKAHQDLRVSAEKKFEALPASERQGKVRSDIFREHLNDWFGATNIIVFRRFLKGE